MNVQISAQQDPHTIWLIKTNSCFHPYLPSSNRWHEPQLRGAQVRPSPPYSITSWNYCCKTNVKVSFGDYNPSHWANHFLTHLHNLHIVATSAHEAEDEPGKPQLDSTPHPSHLPGSFSCGVPQFSHWYYDEYTTQTAHQSSMLLPRLTQGIKC